MTQAFLAESGLGAAGDFVAAIESDCRVVKTPIQRAHIAQALVSSALRDGDWLPERFLTNEATRYRSRTLHVGHESGITIRVLAWRRGQHTPIHDHVSWCVIGVYAGQERELRYSNVSMSATPRLRLTGDHVMRAGETALLLPPDDIHEVCCLTDDAVSIHVYGRALEGDAPSMRHMYEPSDVVAPLPRFARALHI
ncbi:MAG: metal-dependent hydrolase [Candidatus Dormibacteria bacterium]